jgi:hypothetical protein
LSAHDTWQWHIRQVFPTAKISIIEQGPERKRRPFVQSLTGNYNYFICHYEALRLKEVSAALRKVNWFHIMCDECVPIGTEILTAEGWKTYDQLVIGEQVFGYENGQLVLTTLKAINLPGKRPVGALQTKSFMAIATSNHDWIMENKYSRTVQKITSAEHKPRGDHQEIVLAAPYAGGRLAVTEREAAIIAWILGDGGIYPMKKTAAGKDTSYSAFIFQTKPTCIEVVDRLLNGIEHTKTLLNENDEPGGFGSIRSRYKWRISIEYIRELFERAGLDHKNKSANLIPFVLRLTQGARASFCEAAELAEGNNSSHQYEKKDGTKSKPPRDICQNPGPIQDAFRLAFFLQGEFPSNRRERDRFGLTRPRRKADSFTWTPITGTVPVWCPTTGTGNWVMRQGNLMCITGNCHRVKNRKAQQTRGLKALKPVYKTGLSGTPADNAPDDLWSILNWLYPKKYSAYWRHVHEYCEETEVEGKEGATFKKVVGPNRETVPHMLAEMSPWYIRRLKEDVLTDLPPKYYSDVWVDLSAEQRKLYNQMRKDMIAWIGEHEDTPLTAGIVVAQLVRLQQFALATPLIDYKYVVTKRAREYALLKGGEPVPEKRMVVKLIEPSSKLDALEEIVDDNPTEQLIVFSQSKHMVNLVAQRMARKGVSTGLYTGDIRDRATRDATVAAFQRGDLHVFAGTIAAGAETITLTASSTVVFLDRHWSPTKNKQAEDRAHRIGQSSAVQVIDIMARDTVDLGRRQQVATKWDNLRYLLGDTVDPDKYARALAALDIYQSESSIDSAVTEALRMFGGE